MATELLPQYVTWYGVNTLKGRMVARPGHLPQDFSKALWCHVLWEL